MARYSTKKKPKQKPKKSLLPLWLALIGLGLVLVAGWVIWSSNYQAKANIEVKGEPRLKVEKDTIDHGDIKLGIRSVMISASPMSATSRCVSPKRPLFEVKQGC